MELLETEEITITRVLNGTHEKGQWVEGDKDTFSNVLVNIQPLPGKELLQLPESDREKAIAKIYSKTEIKLSDRITRTLDGLDYKLLEVRDWTKFSLPHFRGIMALNN